LADIIFGEGHIDKREELLGHLPGFWGTQFSTTVKSSDDIHMVAISCPLSQQAQHGIRVPLDLQYQLLDGLGGFGCPIPWLL